MGIETSFKIEHIRDIPLIDRLKRLIFEALSDNLRLSFKDFLYKLRTLVESKKWNIPSNVAIETTTDCNRQCAYCPLGNPIMRADRKVQQMSPELFSFVINELVDINFGGKVALQGYGEPMKDPLILDRIKEVKSKLPKAYITFNSNGDYLNAKILQQLIDAGLNHVYITNHSNFPEPPVNIQEILDDSRLKKYVSYYKKLMKLENRGGLVDLKKFEEQKRVATQKDVDRCISNLHSLTVNVDGSVSFCANDFARQENELLGKLGPDQETLMEVWNKEEYKKYRTHAVTGHVSHPLCSRCNIPIKE